MSVCESAKGECSDCDDECGSVADETLSGFRGEEHDVSDHHERGTEDEVSRATVSFGGDIGDQEGGDCSDGIWRDCAELLLDAGKVGIDSSDDCWEEESEALDCDVVEEEDQRDG